MWTVSVENKNFIRFGRPKNDEIFSKTVNAFRCAGFDLCGVGDRKPAVREWRWNFIADFSQFSRSIYCAFLAVKSNVR